MALRHALPDGDLARAGARRADGRHPPDDRGAGHLRCGRLAADRLLRASAGRRRVVHLDRQLVSVRRGVAAAGIAAAGPVLVRASEPWTSVARLVGAGVPDRSRAQRVTEVGKSRTGRSGGPGGLVLLLKEQKLASWSSNLLFRLLNYARIFFQFARHFSARSICSAAGPSSLSIRMMLTATDSATAKMPGQGDTPSPNNTP